MATSRAEQRRQTEQRILTAARRLFSEQGYERTTIRAVAAEAAADPGLVMRYFESKEGLFSQVARIDADAEAAIGGSPAEVADTLLTSLGDKLVKEPAAALALLRSMLTHPEASREVHAYVSAQQRRIAGALPHDNSALRADLLGAIMLGTLIGRYLIRMEALQDAPPEEITALLAPCFQALAGEASDGAHDPARADDAPPQ
ncbi:TetR family transcriptional regulator [Streptomyces glebosus]|uniref:TetR family transcriptional regulator n=1 Tax=Streptomyces glebosus TaxID=249580 RepID=A0A640SS02_9ACTN|nr:TetR/AcrR family transcriptional regulator [Streptomyces glebosus]GFE13634.1 TetR family transcriptional regulator [Streptomyces glebosus]GHG64961.1 TetR family transcriptional regulator [Streptomyces glebosus]